MAQQAQITIIGNVGKDPVRLGQEGGTPACSFRLASTPGFWNRDTRQWQDLPTTWIRVKAFWSLAANVLTSVRKGDPVIVTGTLVTEQWTRDGMVQTALAIEADAIGHDLNRGTGVFTRKAASTAGDAGSVDAGEANDDPSEF